MKNLMAYLIILPLLCISCQEEALSYQSTCEVTCEDESVSKVYTSTDGLIRKVVIGPDAEGKILDTFYVIQDYEQNILVPCNKLTNEFQKDSLKIQFSGNEMSCCNLITQPHYRVSYGCKFEITSIKVLENTSK